jgi:CRISPR type IV-associated protein Csf3
MMGGPLALPARKRPYPIMLDSVVIEIMSRLNGETDDCPFSVKDSPYVPERNEAGVPLAVAGKKKKYYCASAMEISNSAEARAITMTRKTACWLEEFSGYMKNRINPHIDSGVYIPAMEMYRLIVTPYVRFYCVGDATELRGILDYLRYTGLGVRRAVGLGEVLHVNIESVEKDYSVVSRDGTPARHIPVEEMPAGKGWLKDYCSYKPPYWHEENRDMCWVPPLYRWMPV